MDEPETTEAKETPSPEAAETAAESPSPPWGDDFDAERAWNTIQTQRVEAKELKQQAQRAAELEAQWNDEQALIARLQERGYEIEADEDPDLFEDEGNDTTELAARLARLEQEDARRAFNTDLDKLATGADVTLSERDRQIIENDCQKHGANQAALKKAFEEWQQWRKDSETEAIERYRKSKKAPHVSQVGSQATDTPDLDSMSRSDRVKWMTEQFQQDRQQQ